MKRTHPRLTLTKKQKAFLQRQLTHRVALEEQLKKELRRTFRRYVSQITQFARVSGLFYFPNELRLELQEVLLRHYKRSSRVIIALTTPTEMKAYEPFKIEDDPHISKRIKIRVWELFEEAASDTSNRLAMTTEDEIQRYIRRIEKEARNENLLLSHDQIAKFTRDYYYKRIDSRSKSISITETTYPIETTKKVMTEEALSDLTDERLLELAEEGDVGSIEELDDALALLPVDTSLTAEDLLLIGGKAAILVALTATKTWVTVLDDVTRPEHADADGQTVGASDSFDVGGEELEYPGADGSPENTINCRCTVIYSDGRDDEGDV